MAGEQRYDTLSQIFPANTNESPVSQIKNIAVTLSNKTEQSPPEVQNFLDDTNSQDNVVWLEDDSQSDNQHYIRGEPWSTDQGASIYREYPSWSEELIEPPSGDEEYSSYDKRFMRGLQKRFMRGFQKRFMRGLQKRFMRGFRSSSTDDNRVRILTPRLPPFDLYRNTGAWYVPQEKRFMRGLTKRSIPDIETDKSTSEHPLHSNVASTEKRFMRGFTKKNAAEIPKEASSNLPDGVTSEISSPHEDDKRFMRGLHSFDKRENELTDDEMTDTGEKRFMRGFTKKEDKRFLRGLIKKEHTENDKRFMRGLVKKDDTEGSQEQDKQTIQDFTQTDEKRFMRGLIKKDEKRFMRGFAKKDHDTLAEEKRFMRGFNKKNVDATEEEKRFMRGFNKKDFDATEEEKRFMRGLIKKDSGIKDDKRFMRGLVKKDLDKRFMRGLIKKAAQQEDKRFMRGLVTREADSQHRVKRQTRFNDQIRNPLLEKLEEEYSDDDDDEEIGDESWMDYPALPVKRFMRGFDVYTKRFWKDQHHLIPIDDDVDINKRFMRGFQVYDDDAQKRFTSGHTAGPTWYNNMYDNLDEYNLPEKKFIKGLDAYFKAPVGKRFMRGLDFAVPEKRFLRGLEYYSPKFRNNLRIHKKFLRGLDAYKKSILDEPEYRLDSKSLWSSDWDNRLGQSELK
ncbi:hypothetical protein BgiBS90_003538 [Biomphalaria glabrata]|nr:hypothetical protein BgiBS90_003538 [Biomphalaria glabrata]